MNTNIHKDSENDHTYIERNHASQPKQNSLNLKISQSERPGEITLPNLSYKEIALRVLKSLDHPEHLEKSLLNAFLFPESLIQSVISFANSADFSSLLRIMKSSRFQKSLALASSNAMSILSQQNYSLSNRTLVGCKFQSSKLLNLTSSAFFNCDFRHCKAREATFFNSNLTNCNLLQVDLGIDAVLEKHEDKVKSVCFSPDGRRLASGSMDCTVKVWNLNTGQLAYSLHGHIGTVNSVAFSPNGQLIASGSEDRTIKVWCKEDLVYTFSGHYLAILSVDFTTDSQFLASGGDKTVKIWNLANGELAHNFEGHFAAVNSIAFSADRAFIVSGSSDSTIKLWKLETREVTTFKDPKNIIFAVKLSRNAKHLVSGGMDRTIKIWEIESKQIVRILEGYSKWIKSLSFSPNERYIIFGSHYGSINIWDLESDQSFCIFQEGKFHINSISYSPDGRYVAAIGHKGNIKILEHNYVQDFNSVNAFGVSRDFESVAKAFADHSIRVWSTRSGELKFSLVGNSNHIQYIIIHKAMIASLSVDGVLILWENGKAKAVFDNEQINPNVPIMFSPCGNFIAAGSYVNIVKVWRTDTALPVQILHDGFAKAISIGFSSDSKLILSSCENFEIRIWNLDTGYMVYQLKGLSIKILHCSFSQDSSQILCRYKNGYLRIYNLLTGLAVYEFSLPYLIKSSISVSDNWKYVGFTCKNALVIWNVKKNKRALSLRGPFMSIVLSSDGRSFIANNGTLLFGKIKKSYLDNTISRFNC